MPSCAFEIDDIAVADRGSVILAKGERRIALDKLSQRQVDMLVEARRTRTIPVDAESEAILVKLRGIGFPFEERGSRWPKPRIAAGRVAAAARPLIGLAHPVWISLFLIAGFAGIPLLLRTAGRLDTLIGFVVGSLPAFAAFMAGFWIPLIAHELGHAAACLRSTGLVGGVRVKLHWGMPAFATDVSAIAKAAHRDRKWINLAGPAFHMAAALAVFGIGSAVMPPLATGALFSFTLGFLALFPLPGFDGFWILQDAAGRKIEGPLRRPRRGDMLAPIYCWVLLVFFLGMLAFSAAYWGHQLFDPAYQAGAARVVVQAMAGFALFSGAIGLFVMTRFLSEARNP